MFFECPITKSYRPKLESTRLGLLSVTGGELSIPAIVAELQRLVPVENFAWECRQVGHNVFKVTFPDREEIERLARFGTFQVPNSKIQLTFEQCVSSMEPTSNLPEIWILMSGIPQRRIGDFLATWSLGTLFGKTLKLDMKYTREKGVLRILVGCLDFKRIPAKENIFIGDGFYDISFEVEIQHDLEMVAAANPGDDPSDNDGHGNNGDSTSKSPKNQDAMDTDTTLNFQDQEGANQSSASGPEINKLAGEFSSGVKFSPRVKQMMEQSRVEISAFIASLTAAEENPAEMASATPPATAVAPAVSAAAAENSAEKAAATTPAPALASVVSAAVPAPAAVSSAAARPACVAEASAAGAETLLDTAAAPSAAAFVSGLADEASFGLAATTISAVDTCNDISEAIMAMESRAPSSPISTVSTSPPGCESTAPDSPATEAVDAAAGDPHANSQQHSFRVPAKNEREVL
jgi:hypothetical protein